MKPPLQKPCRICGDPVTPGILKSRKAYWYPRQCKKCFKISRNEFSRRKRISVATTGVKNHKSLPLYTERVDKRGYVIIKVSYSGRWPTKHRWMMEQHLERKLERHEVVHHIDHNKLNNSIENLKIMFYKCHSQLHSVIDKWSLKYDSCIKCGTTEKRHNGHGLCSTCEQRKRAYSHRNSSTGPKRERRKYGG